MKFLTLLALPAVIHTLTEFKSKEELTGCIMACGDLITPCIHDKSCQPEYTKCVDHKDPFTCLSSINHILISKVVQCFD